MKDEKTDSEGTTEREEDQKPDKGTGFKLFIYCKYILYAQTMYYCY